VDDQHLYASLLSLSSMAEQEAVNFKVVGSNPAGAAIKLLTKEDKCKQEIS
jgi:hypothetical protein